MGFSRSLLRRAFLIVLAPSKPKAQARAEVDTERGIAHNFFIVLVERILNVRVCGDMLCEGIPSAEIDAAYPRHA